MTFGGSNLSVLCPWQLKRLIFMGKTRHEVENMFGLEQYLENYGCIQKGVVHLGNPEHRHEFEDWLVTIPFTGEHTEDVANVDILCCPEDKRCIKAACTADQRRVCRDCEVPVCKDCEMLMQQQWDIFEGMYPPAPARALSNDMMIFMLRKVCMSVG